MILGEKKGPLRIASAPRSIVKVNNKVVPFYTCTVELNGYSAADTFDITLPFFITDNLEGSTDFANTPDQQSILLTKSKILVEVYAGYPDNPNHFNENDLTQLMYGYMDTANWTFDEQGERVELQGRNQVAPFMDNKTTDKFPNKTSSSIASYFAKRHGLSTQITPTYTLAGHYYSNDNTTLTTDSTEWDFLNYLAEQEGFVLRVKGNTLYFGPRDSFLKSNPFIYTWGHNILDMTLSRSPHAAKNIKVEVVTWSSHKKARMVATASKSSTNADEEFVETYYIPGLTKSQAQAKANTILSKLSQTELTGSLETLGDEQMNIDQPIMLEGLGLPSNNRFWPTQVTHTFDIDEEASYDMTINFSNLNLPTDPGGL